jgi:hypothetical protein
MLLITTEQVLIATVTVVTDSCDLQSDKEVPKQHLVTDSCDLQSDKEVPKQHPAGLLRWLGCRAVIRQRRGGGGGGGAVL